MKLQGAVVKEQGVTFSIVIVKATAMHTTASADSTRAAFQHVFPVTPLILACQDSSGRFKYQGRKDIVGFLANIDPRRIPWKEYTVS
jgi:hypothetical protein